ncbi:hypothetical protein V499_05233 [Pseudogymnoascus sp. VKM F-103]|uniref:Uncharacterized protein n=1 Tax=Pseudogymnoascus verrucosus TaxID=342668 RepID=A0A1B8GBW6_9PEZI|nr:uncharacterized protein VE01_08417 [Pseudogymnoascus verrucosus]KFY74761.1 hypothetical protein V499_05233 [Pseudogymnoascus sp. VKM F-103]OBT93326.1 hypothetical protein VE01_08417 [Pseudogymnoascus verrucosus]
MDFLKKAAGELQGNKNAAAGGSAPAATDGSAPAAGASTGQQQDYGDKAFAAISQKTGHTFSADQSEKITDGLRGAYEKATGNKVDPKYSN